MNTTKLTLEDFKAKATKKFQDRQISVDIDADEYGSMTFNRPTENELLAYINKTGNSVVTDKEENVISKDMGSILDASKDLVYSCCGFLKDVELQTSLEVIDPIDTVTKVFSITKTIEIASEIASTFMDSETMAKVEEEIKN